MSAGVFQAPQRTLTEKLTPNCKSKGLIYTSVDIPKQYIETTDMFITFTLNPAYEYRDTEIQFDKFLCEIKHLLDVLRFIGYMTVEYTDRMNVHIHTLGKFIYKETFTFSKYVHYIKKKVCNGYVGRLIDIQQAQDYRKIYAYITKECADNERAFNKTHYWEFLPRPPKGQITDYLPTTYLCQFHKTLKDMEQRLQDEELEHQDDIIEFKDMQRTIHEMLNPRPYIPSDRKEQTL